MTKLLPIIGNYKRNCSQLQNQNITLVLCERKKPGKKPAKYLLQKAKTFTYISSLYPVSGTTDTFMLDYQGTDYTLQLSGDQATIFQNLVNPTF